MYVCMYVCMYLCGLLTQSILTKINSGYSSSNVRNNLPWEMQCTTFDPSDINLDRITYVYDCSVLLVLLPCMFFSAVHNSASFFFILLCMKLNFVILIAVPPLGDFLGDFPPWDDKGRYLLYLSMIDCFTSWSERHCS